MEGRILTIVVGWYSGYQEGRYFFQLWCVVGVFFVGWCGCKVNLKSQQIMRNGKFWHHILKMKTLMKLQFSREIWLHQFFAFVISLKTFQNLLIVLFVGFCCCVKIYGIRLTDTSFIGLKSCVEKVVFFKCLI